LGGDESGFEIGFSNGSIDFFNEGLELLEIRALKSWVELFHQRSQRRGRIRQGIRGNIVVNEVALLLSPTNCVKQILSVSFLLRFGELNQVLLIIPVVAEDIREFCGTVFDIVRLASFYCGLQSIYAIDIFEEIGRIPVFFNEGGRVVELLFRRSQCALKSCGTFLLNLSRVGCRLGGSHRGEGLGA
jgi:hypothetical protein